MVFDIVDDTPSCPGEPFDEFDGSSIVVLSGSGIIVESNAESMTAKILLDEECSSFAGRTMCFDFSKHTEYLPVLLNEVNAGDRVKITFFHSADNEAILMGESLIPLDSNITVG